MDTKGIANSAYHSAVLGLFTILYSMLGEKVFKIKPADLGKLDIKDGLKLTTTVAAASMTQMWLVHQGILPKNVMNSME